MLISNGYTKSKNIFLIPPFENLSNTKSMTTYEVATSSDPNNPKRHFTIDRYSEIPRAILEDKLISLGAEVVERQRLDQLLLESEFVRLSGLVQTEKAIKLGKMLGANIVCMGTIVNIQSKESTFSGYGVRTRNTKVTCSLRIRFLDIESGKNVFSKIVKGNVSYSSSQFGGLKDSDVAYSVIEATLEELFTDDDFLNYFGK
jgi:curli biogenesis system outer membrane secretion channel CsgG